MLAGDPQARGVPSDRQPRAAVRAALARFPLNMGRHAWNRRDAFRDVFTACHPLRPLGRVIPFHPALDRDEHPDHLFPTDLHGSGVPVMRRAVDPGGLDQVLAPQKNARALRSADDLAAAVAHEGGAALQVNVRDRQDFRRGVDHDGDLEWPGDVRDRFERHRAGLVPPVREDVDHRRLRPDRELELLGRIHLDDLHPDSPDRRVVDVPRMTGDDHFVSGKPGKVRDAHVHVRIAPRHACGGGVRHGRRAAGAHHPPLRARQFAQSLAYGIRQFVELDVLLIGR